MCDCGTKLDAAAAAAYFNLIKMQKSNNKTANFSGLMMSSEATSIIRNKVPEERKGEKW